jgi:hypothetical protein
MREEVRHKWRIKWAGRWTTSHHCTEEAIHREHPEARQVPGTMQVIQVAETPEEVARFMYGPGAVNRAEIDGQNAGEEGCNGGVKHRMD